MLRTIAVASLFCFLSFPTVSAEEPTIGDYTTFWRPTVGSWKMTIDADGEVITGTFKFRIGPNKKCCLLYHGAEGGPFIQQLQGYDPVAKKLVANGVSETGDRWIQTFNIDGMKKGMRAAEGVGGDWEKIVYGADGTTKTATSTWKFLQVEENMIVMEWSNIKGNIDDHKKLTMTLEREE
jgi:hypothetical protein